MYVTCTALWTEPRRSRCLSPGMWANMRRQSGTCIQYEDAQGQRDGWRGVGGKMGCFPGAGGTWWGCSEGCNVFTHWGLYLLAIVPIKLRNKPASNSVANNKCLLSGNVWQEDSYVLSLMSPSSPFKRNSTLLPGTEVIVWGRPGSPLVNIFFRTKLLSLVPLSWGMDCLLTLWLTLPLVPLVTAAVHLVFWSLSFLKEVSCTAAYIYS